MAHIILSGRSLIAISGADAETLMHNVVTCDIHKLVPGTWQPGGLLTPQGKVMFHFLVTRRDDGVFAVDIERPSASAFIQRMTLYRLRSQVEFSAAQESLVRISFGSVSTGGRDLRFPEMAEVSREWLSGADGDDLAALADYTALRIRFGVPEPGVDFALGDVFPHDISFDQNGGVDFKKGCYVGQEVVSRMQHRGTARRRLMVARGAGDLTPGDVSAGGKPLGVLGSVDGCSGLVLGRIDRAAQAMRDGVAIVAGEMPVELSLPDGVTYTWPETTGEDDG